MTRDNYIKVSDLKDELGTLAAEKFSVVDPRYPYMLEVLEMVEDIVDIRLHKYPEPEVRTGYWIMDPEHPKMWICSICGAKVFWIPRKGRERCRYPSCPCCKTPMKIEEVEA